ncbi:MAG: prolyl oligopeptidase family serine peptidase [Candidatus Latescibacteria bacterium]|mgnify:CR=1 FL=1|jgi:poly(3-hydroxybutyrate) depolymerase|nr:prolyl oligopeptidase family serine peptidase [Candidatus Latescibacterota bacterium]
MSEALYIEGFARALSASNQGDYATGRGINGPSSWEYARDGEQRVVWETAPVPEVVSQDTIVFVWSSTLDASEAPHELSLNDQPILEFSSGGFDRPKRWSAGDVELEFEPRLGNPRFQVHGLMRLRMPRTALEPQKPATLQVRGKAAGGAWFMIHHFTDAHGFADTGTLSLPSGRRVCFASPISLFKGLESVTWQLPVLMRSEDAEEADEIVQLEAKLLQQDGTERLLNRELFIRPDALSAPIDLWSTADLAQGEHTLLLSATANGETATWQGQIVIHHLEAFRESKQQVEALVARMETDEQIPEDLRQLSLPGVAYGLEAAHRHLEGIRDTSLFAASYDAALQRIEETAAAMSDIGEGLDPYEGERGYVERAYRSSLDHTLQPYGTHIPADYDSAQSYPLMVMLHGFGGTPRGAIQSVMGGEEEDLNHQFLIVAPANRGNIGYTHHIGEADVWQVLADVQRLYNVDENRIYLTGVSMGGGGTWHLGLRHADRFAAIASVCGFTDWRVEAFLVASASDPLREQVLDTASPLSWAENATHLPVLAAHGEADPVVKVGHSRRMVARLREMGAPVEYEEYPGVGHVSWNETYAKGRIFEWFGRHVRDPRPAHVVHVTMDPLRYGSSFWIHVEALAQARVPARIEAHARDGRIEIETTDLKRFRLSTDGLPLGFPEEIRVTVDGHESFSGLVSGESITFQKRNGVFEPTSASPRRMIPVEGQRRASSGWRIYVYGTTGTPQQNAITQRAAESMATPNSNVRIQYPVMVDTSVTEQDMATADLILLGTAQTNALVGRIDAELPIRHRGDVIQIGGKEHSADGVLLAQVVPNPLAPSRMVQVLAASTTEAFAGLERMKRGAPDYVIVTPDGEVIAEGAFDLNWELP